jgi:rhamnosyltransferase
VNAPAASIVMRSFNEAWALKGTLEALKAQAFTDWELIVIDSGSTDGSQDLIRAARPRHFVQITPAEYNPSRVMNQGMRLAEAAFGIFLNADATPQGPGWLGPLVQALQDPRVAACFGRQIPRRDCQAVFACDYDRCFGPQRESAHWDHFFSMVSSGLRKDVWAQRGFREDLQYAEDDEYTRWCRGRGYSVVYVPESVAMHSHNYTAAQAFKRAFGDARSMAATWPGGAGDLNFVRTVLLGWAQDFRKDVRFCLREQRLGELVHAARIRWQQRRGRLAGFRQGWRDYRVPKEAAT